MTPTPGVTERRDKHGRIRYQVRVRRAGTSQVATLPSYEAALAWRAQALAAIDGLSDPPTRPKASAALSAPPRHVVTVEEAARRLCRAIRDGSVRNRSGREYKPSVVRNYEGALRRLVLPSVGAVPTATLTGGDCQKLVDEIASRTSPAHARAALAALRVTLRVCERYGEIDSNPCVAVRAPAVVEERTARVLSVDESAALIAAAVADDEAFGRSFAGAFVSLALGTGLRVGELLALPWGSEGLDLEARVVRVRRSVDRARDATGDYPFVAPKSRHGRRDVPLAPEDASMLRRHRLASGRPADGALVFADVHGRPLPPHGVPRAAWERITSASGISEPLPRLHDLRHSFASHALAAGLSAHAVARLLGHSDAGLVWRRYGHALPDELANAGESLSAWRAAAQSR
jgi:integrase